MKLIGHLYTNLLVPNQYMNIDEFEEPKDKSYSPAEFDTEMKFDMAGKQTIHGCYITQGDKVLYVKNFEGGINLPPEGGKISITGLYIITKNQVTIQEEE